jgi:hypothetical protein
MFKQPEYGSLTVVNTRSVATETAAGEMQDTWCILLLLLQNTALVAP